MLPNGESMQVFKKEGARSYGIFKITNVKHKGRIVRPSSPGHPTKSASVRDRPLIKGGGGGGGGTKQGGGGGASEVLPLTKKGSFSHAEGRHKQVGLTQELEVLAILKKGTKSFYPLEGGTQKAYPEGGGGGGGATSFGPVIFSFCGPPSP